MAPADVVEEVVVEEALVEESVAGGIGAEGPHAVPTAARSAEPAPPVRAWLLVVAAIGGIAGLLMMIIPLAGSSNLRALLVLLFMVVGVGLIALAIWLSRHPNRTLASARDELVDSVLSRKKPEGSRAQGEGATANAASGEEAAEAAAEADLDDTRPLAVAVEVDLEGSV